MLWEFLQLFVIGWLTQCVGVLNQFVSDIYIYTDHCKGGQSGKYVILQQTFNFFTSKSACFTTIQ